jgi:cytochrome c oxidase assembly protein subunit 11
MKSHQQANRRLGLILLGVVGLMVGASFASVPFYRLFCQLTGYGGTPRIAVGAQAASLPPGGRIVTVRFNTDVADGLPWKFRPLQQSIDLRLGESGLALFEARNLTDQPISGLATFNVTPDKAGQYFIKTQCFCLTTQTLGPGQRADMPVSFQIDPKLGTDPLTEDVKTITLSYTFFRSKENAP